MTSLAIQQQALLQTLFEGPLVRSADGARDPGQDGTFFTGERGLLAYRSNAHALAERSLQASHPVLAQLLGDDSFKLLARDFWHQHPPHLGDLAQWGGELAGFLQVNTQLSQEPYLGDVARVEWLLHQAAGAADRAPDRASLSLLGTEEPEALTLVLASGTAVLSSVYPVASIAMAHLDGSPTLEQAGHRMRQGVQEIAVVWRHGFKPRLAPCSAAQATMLQALLAGESLLAALECAGEVDFDLWLPTAVQSGLVLGARRLAPM